MPGKKLKVFISDVNGYLGSAVAVAFRRDLPTATISGSSIGKQATYPVGSPAAISGALQADIIVLSLTSALIEGQAVIEALREYVAALPPLEPPGDDEAASEGGEEGEGAPSTSKTVIALSTTISWDRTTSMPAPWEEANYKRRRPGLKGADVRDTEIAVMALARPDRGVRCHVIAAGMPYGGGAGPLYTLLRRAWLCVDNAPAFPLVATSTSSAGSSTTGAVATVGLPVPCIREERGKNKIPTIHIKDLAAFAVRVASSSSDLQPEASQGEYFLAVDESTDSLVDIVGAISKAVGCGGIRLLPKEEAVSFFEDSDAGDVSGVGATAKTELTSTAALKPMHLGGDSSLVATAQVHLSQSATFDAASASIFSDGKVALSDEAWHCRGGIVAHMDTLAAEFLQVNDLRPMRLVVGGAPSSGKTHISQALAAKYAVPHVHVKGAIAAIRAGNLRALSDGSPERLAALTTLREAVEKVSVDFEAAQVAALAAADKNKKKDPKAKGPASGAGGASGGKEELEVVLSGSERGVRLPRALLARVVRATLLSPTCRNKGWVLDSYPRTWEEADALFGAIPEDDDGITPPEGEASGWDASTAGKEEGEEDAAVTSEAVRKHVVVHALGVSLTGEPTKKPEGEEGEEGGEEEGGDEVSGKKDSEPKLRPAAAVVLDACDPWLEARAISSEGGGAAARERFTRRLRKYRLHNHPGLAHTPLGWLEVNAKLETCELRVDAVSEALAPATAATAPASGSSGTSSSDELVGEGGVAAAVALAHKFASEDGDEDARIAARVQRAQATATTAVASGASTSLSPFTDLDVEVLVPGDLPPPQHASALLDLAILKYCGTFANKGGKPANFHPTAAECAALAGVLAGRQSRRGAVRADAKKVTDAEEDRVRADHAAIEAQHAAAAGRAQAALLEARTAPLRAYLLQHVIPHITAGLIEVCKAGPVDPVEHLADYLFKTATAQEEVARAALASSSASSGAASGRKR